MNIIRKQSHKEYSILYIDKPREDIDDFILKSSRYLDVYVYINKNSKINSVTYSNILPINGYIEGKSSEVEGLITLLEFIRSVIKGYYGVYVPYANDINKSFSEVGNLLKQISIGSLTKSVIKSCPIDFELRSKIYSKKSILDTILFILGKNCIDDDCMLTDISNESAFLTTFDLDKILSSPDIDEKYIRSFRNRTLLDFISSSANKLSIDYLNFSINEL